MRLRKVGPAFVAATSLLALAPAAASAHKHPSPLGRCRVNIKLMPALISAGESTEVSGQLTCGTAQAPAARRSSCTPMSPAPPASSPFGSTTTETGGAYKFTSPVENANTSFYVRSLGAQSGRRRLRVEAQVTLTGPPEGTQIETGAPNEETFSGTVTPPPTSARA